MNTRTALPVARTKSKRRPAPVAILSTPPTSAQLSVPVIAPVAPAAEGPRLAAGRTGDHQAIHRLLLAAFHGPNPAEFQAQLDTACKMRRETLRFNFPAAGSR